MMKRNIFKYIILSGLILILLPISACKKSWLDAKPDIKLTVPESLEDIGALLNSTDIFFEGDPGLGEAGADNYFFPDGGISSPSFVDRNAYLWLADVFETNRTSEDWDYPYKRILTINVALEALEKIKENSSNAIEVQRLKGTALFYRSWSFFALMGIFTKPYNPATASVDLGIPLRLTSNVNEKVDRSTIQACYDKITSDLKQAADLIGNTQKEDKIRASKEAIYGLLSRVYLSMEDYEDASAYANECLKLSGKLMDYNDLDKNAAFPFAKLNKEVIYNRHFLSYGFTYASSIDKELYASYDINDLRRSLFFTLRDDIPVYKGSYCGNNHIVFCGLATDELYLTRAECYARKGNTNLAMKDLNDLLRTRWAYKPGTKESSLIELTAENADDALSQILTERRKELLMRGIRWIDLRRLNKDPRFAKTLTRTVNGKVYSLPPNSNRYVYPIPRDEVDVSGIPQNDRE